MEKKESKIKIKNIYTYIIVSLGPDNNNNSNNITRELVKLDYPLDSIEIFEQFEKDWRSHKKNDKLVIISFSFLNMEQEVFYNNKQLNEEVIESLKGSLNADDAKIPQTDIFKGDINGV